MHGDAVIDVDVQSKRYLILVWSGYLFPGYRRGWRETKQELHRANQRQKCWRRRKICTAITSPEGGRCDGEEQKFDPPSSDKWRPIIRNHWKKSKTSWSVLSLSSGWIRAHRRASCGGAQEGAQVKIALNNGQSLMRMYRNLNYQATQCPQICNKERLTVALKKKHYKMHKMSRINN